MDVDLDRYVTVCKLVPGGEEELVEGTVREILENFASEAIGRPGALFMRLAGQADIVLGKQLLNLVEDYKYNRIK